MTDGGTEKPIPIYTTHGDCSALLVAKHIFNMTGEWIGWLAEDGQVFDVDGFYVGWLSEDRRILRRRSEAFPEKRTPPQRPNSIRAPATVPLPPMMPELPFSVIDVLDEEPGRLHTPDTGELRNDMD